MSVMGCEILEVISAVILISPELGTAGGSFLISIGKKKILVEI